RTLERRFLAMLNPSLNHRTAGRSAVLAVCAAAIFLTVTLAAVTAPEQTPKPPTFSTAVSAVASVAASATPTAAAVLPAPVRKTGVAKPLAAAAAAQQPLDGSLIGAVSDSTGALVPGVTVTVSSIERVTGLGVRENPVETIVSNEAGVFQFRALTPGEYSLKAELPGFTIFRKTGLRIVSSETLKENIVLVIGNVVQRVEVKAAGQPKPQLPAGTPQRIRIGGNIQAANLISQVRPVYPENARYAGLEGTVHLRGIIATDGTLIALRVVGYGDADLGSAALEAVRQWRYRPALLNNTPIEVFTEIDVE